MNALWNILTDWHFWLFTLAMSIIIYPFWGGCMYGDPWTWIFKDDDSDGGAG